MRYLGGKARIGKQLVAYLEAIRKPGQAWVEPFCGGLWVTYLVGGYRVASDANEALINLYKAVQKGWAPPTELTEEEYRKYKVNAVKEDPMTAFVGFGCSFGGKWFGGFARSGERNYCLNAKNSLLKKVKQCKGVTFLHADYRQALAIAPKGSLVYLDPPYASTTGYGETGPFDSGQFWAMARVASQSHDLYISEYSAPPDFKCVLEITTKTDLRNKEGEKELRVEKLFKYQG